MILNGVIVLICVIPPNSIAFEADYVTVAEGLPIMSAKYCLPVTFGQNGPTLQSHGLFATANLNFLCCLVASNDVLRLLSAFIDFCFYPLCMPE